MIILSVIAGGLGVLLLGVSGWLLIDAALAYLRREWDRVSIMLVQGFAYGVGGVLLLAGLGIAWLVRLWLA